MNANILKIDLYRLETSYNFKIACNYINDSKIVNIIVSGVMVKDRIMMDCVQLINSEIQIPFDSLDQSLRDEILVKVCPILLELLDK